MAKTAEWKPATDTARQPRTTVNGSPQSVPEGVGTTSRNVRLFAESVRRIATHPLASPAQTGVPIGDGLGMEELVSCIAPLFQREPSLLRWNAIRCAIGTLYWQSVGDDNGTPFVPVVERAMGVGHIGDVKAGEETLGLSPDWQSEVTSQQAEAAIGVYAAFCMRLFAYERLSGLDGHRFNSEPVCQFGDAVALDFISWAAVAMLRMEAAENWLQLPEPSLLDEPGWYAEPIYAKAERYWDGSDWTERCRTLDGRRYVAMALPIRAST